MYLFVDATQEEGIVLKLADGQFILNTKVVPGDRKLAEKLLVTIDAYLSEHSLKIDELKGLLVVNGPGSFTNVRIICTMANTISQLMDIPTYGDQRVNLDTDQKVLAATQKVLKNNLIIPYYDREPNITM